jgi:hypothetical protein
MRIKFKILIYLFIPVYSISQNGTVSTGGDINSNDANISYSIGQTFFSNTDAENININEGLQQVFIEELTSLKEANYKFKVNVYPNPSSNFIQLEIQGGELKNSIAILSDIQGKHLAEYSIKNYTTSISLKSLASGIYFLNIRNRYKEEYIFKIIKE